MGLREPNKNMEATQIILGALGSTAAAAAGALAKHAHTAAFMGTSAMAGALTVANGALALGTSIGRDMGVLNRHTASAAVDLISEGLFAYTGYTAQADSAQEFFTSKNAAAIACATTAVGLQLAKACLLARIQPHPASAGYSPTQSAGGTATS